MSSARISSIFEGAAAKILTVVEVDTTRSRSNQHEFQGVKKFRELLGTPIEKKRFECRFIRLESDQSFLETSGFVTWSDVRRANPNRSAEYHLYYSSDANVVMEASAPGDILLVCKLRANQDLVVFVVPEESSLVNSLLWLFGLDFPGDKSATVSVYQGEASGRTIGWLEAFLLEELGFEEAIPDSSNYADLLLETFGLAFPTTAEFSRFTQELSGFDLVLDDPDQALLDWFGLEHSLFRQLERLIVEERLRSGFLAGDEVDVDGFISFSLSVQNRRKSRAGHAFENHLAKLFSLHEVPFSNQVRTEGKKKPDFVFPSSQAYHDPSFPPGNLTLLAAKSTCKDRWRQVLSEAARIDQKHLVTMEPGISEDQTSEMQSSSLQLVVPSEIQKTYTTAQQGWLLSLRDFICLVKDRSRELTDR